MKQCPCHLLLGISINLFEVVIPLWPVKDWCISICNNIPRYFLGSDQANVEIKKRVPITSGKTATLLRPMADVLKTSLGFSSEECLTEARPVKEDSYLHEKQTATKASSSNASTESSDAKRDQVGDSDLASKYKLPDDEEVTNPIDYSSSDYDVVRYLLSLENDDSKEYASLKQCMTKT